MADAEAEEDVEIGLRPVQELCLYDGIAHGLEASGTYLLVVPDADCLLGPGAGFARCRFHRESRVTQDFFDLPAFPAQARAVRETELLEIGPPRKLHDFFEPRLDAVARRLDTGGRDRDLPDGGFLVLLQ